MVRANLGLIYRYDAEWVAGAYYILNLIQALKLQPDSKRPTLFIFCKTRAEYKTVQQTGYPYLRFIKVRDLDSPRIVHRLLKHYQTAQNDKVFPKLNALFPASHDAYFNSVPNKIYWIPDFQEEHLPQFFSKDEIAHRKQYQRELIAANYPIVFSSQDALSDFKKLYPAANSPTFVMPFAVTHPPYKHLQPLDLSVKFGITKPYFSCINQFWAHKNHLVLLKAITLLKKRGVTNFQVVFSGKQSDHRNPDYYQELMQKVHRWGLEPYCVFLGFIDRQEQLAMIEKSIAVIQPSLFEGWSTVVEDVKAMNQRVILSDLNVHREQNPVNATYFDPHNEQELADTMQAFLVQLSPQKKLNYSRNVRAFGKNFLNIIDAVTDKSTK